MVRLWLGTAIYHSASASQNISAAGSLQPKDFSSRNEGGFDLAAQRPAAKRRVVAFRFELLRINRPFSVRITHCHIGNRTCGQAASVEMEGARRANRQHFDETGE